MTHRIDMASRHVAAAPDTVFGAFARPGAMERWIPPTGMTGEMLHFDFRDGGSYRMRLTYFAPHGGHGKTSEDADEVEVRLTKVEEGRRIEQEVVFESDDTAYHGVMRMTWTLTAEGERTLVTVRAEDVPAGIRSEDHEAAMRASLEGLARFVEAAG